MRKGVRNQIVPYLTTVDARQFQGAGNCRDKPLYVATAVADRLPTVGDSSPLRPLFQTNFGDAGQTSSGPTVVASRREAGQRIS